MLAGMLAAAAIAPAECPPSAPGQPKPISSNPDWLKMPQALDMLWAYPPRAVIAGQTGRATIHCDINTDGVLEDCKVILETPKGQGFGDAALALSKKMLLKPKVTCGVPVRGTVEVPLVFALPKPADPAAMAPLDPTDKKLSAAARLVHALYSGEAMKRAADETALRMIREVEATRETNADERGALNDAAIGVLTDAEAKVFNAIARGLAARMTEEDLTRAADFYEGPTGTKLMAVQRDLTMDMMSVFTALQPEMILDFRRRYCEQMQSLCAPDDAI